MTGGATDRAGGRATGSTSIGLFVIWPVGRSRSEPIVRDLADRFEILDLVEVTWSDHLVRRNYERFYSDLDVAGVYHELNKGRGPFLAVVVRDRNPVIEPRQTTRGLRPVSANFVDAKHHYRDMLGSLGVHCGESEWESTRDLAVLLGLTPCELAVAEPMNIHASPTSVHRDPTGSEGWSSPAEMLAFLDPIVPYVAIGGPAPGDRPIQLITSDLHAVHTLVDGRPVDGHPRPVGGRFLVTVAGRTLPIEIRPVSSGLIDEAWARAVLADRRPDEDGIHRAPPEDELAIRAYLAVTRRRRLGTDDLTAIHTLAGSVPAGDLDRRAATAIVTGYLDRHGYRFVQPLDPTDVVHRPDDTAAIAVGRRLRAGLATAWVRARGHGLAVYLGARASAMVRLPGLRTRWRRWRHGEGTP